MTQSTPTEAWLKEARREAAKNCCGSYGAEIDPQCNDCKNFLAGAQWQRERSAPDEQEWGKLRNSFKIARHSDANPQTQYFVRVGFNEGFDAAVNLIARPLLAEVERTKHEMWDSHTTQQLKLIQERDSARAEVASLRQKLRREEMEHAGNSETWMMERDLLRAQRAETVTILERLQKSDEWCGKPFNEDIGEFLNKLRAQEVKGEA